MTSDQVKSKLSAAVMEATRGITQRLATGMMPAQDEARGQNMSGNARKCPDLPGQIVPKSKTNPPGNLAERGRQNRPLAPRQLAAVDWLLCGKTACATARVLGVNERTVRRWWREERFRIEARRRLETCRKTQPTLARQTPPNVSGNVRFCPDLSGGGR